MIYTENDIVLRVKKTLKFSSTKVSLCQRFLESDDVVLDRIKFSNNDNVFLYFIQGSFLPFDRTLDLNKVV